MRHRHRSIAAWCTALFLLNATLARAQAPAAEPPPRLEATAQAGFLSTTGNASAQSVGLSGDMTYRPNVWTYTAKTAFAQTEDEGDLTARSVTALFRAGRALTPTLASFGQYDFLHDRFAGIESRHTVQGGLSFLAFDHAPQRLRLDGGVGFEQENRVEADDTSNAVALGGVGYRWQISSTSELNEELRATLPFSNGDQWKLDQGISLTASITSLFSLKVSNTVRYSNAPVPGFEKTDTITSIALVMKFKRPQP